LFERGPVTIPDLPVAEPHRLTLAHWEDLWASPVAPEMTRIDGAALVMYIMLCEDFFRADNPTARIDLSREIRLIRDGFGFTPASRRRLQWSIANIVDAEARRADREARINRSDPRVKPPRPKDPRVHE